MVHVRPIPRDNIIVLSYTPVESGQFYIGLNMLVDIPSLEKLNFIKDISKDDWMAGQAT